jgi:drug/metabolite transporter (DMT)-like permease
MPPIPERLRGSPLLVISSFLFAVMAFCARSVAGRLSVGQVVCARFVIGLAFLALYSPLTRTRPRMGRPRLWVLRGVFGGGSVYLYFVAIDRLAVGPATLLNACWPICAAILGIFILGERVNGYLATGLTATTVGAGLVIWSTVQGGMGFTLGVGAWAGALSAVLSGAAVIALRALRHDTDASSIFLSFCLFGLLFGMPFALQDWRPLSGDMVLPLLGVGLASVAAQMIFTYAMAHVTSTAVGGITTQLTPAFSWMLGALLLGEPLQPLAVVGALICMGGLLWGTGLAPRLLIPASRPSP